MTFDRFARRKLLSRIITVVTGLTIVAVLYPLVSILYTAAVNGGTVLFQPGFLTSLGPTPCDVFTCATVGIGPAIQGSAILVAFASAISVPVGVMAAIFASEYRARGVGRVVSFTADVLTGVPSIIMGAFVYAYFVLEDPTVAVSALTGGLALSALMIPIITRTTEEALRTVPNSVREAAVALGISKWKYTLRIVVIAALPGIVTGVLLGVMRATGDAAALLFMGSAYGWFRGFGYPVAALPVQIYLYALSSYSNWIKVAWGMTLFLLAAVLIVNVLSRYMIHRLSARMKGG
jgi:phosphate transport system permease protein